MIKKEKLLDLLKKIKSKGGCISVDSIIKVIDSYEYQVPPTKCVNCKHFKIKCRTRPANGKKYRPRGRCIKYRNVGINDKIEARCFGYEEREG